MENILQILPLNVAEALGWTLIHSLWQSFGLLILTLTFMYFAKRNSTKYNIGISAILMQIIISTVTFVYIYEPIKANNYLILNTQSLLNNTNNQIGDTSNLGQLSNWIAMQIPTIVTLWIVGLIFYILRFGYNFWQVNLLKKQNIQSPSMSSIAIFEKLKRKINLKKDIRFMYSARVNTPVLIGHLKPLILLPIGLCSQLSAQEIEAIIAHEMAHIKRNDYFINLIQSLIEVIYFFNPSIYILSKLIRDERENCCDEFASEICGSALPIAKALVQIETFRQENQLAMAFGRKGASLKNRVRRILGLAPEKANQNKGIFIILLLLVICIGYFTIEKTMAQQEPSNKMNHNKKHLKKSKPHYNYIDENDGTRKIMVNNGKEKLSISQTNGTVYVNDKAYKLAESDSIKMMYHQAEIKKLTEEMNQYSQKMSELGSQMGKLGSELATKSQPLASQSQAIASLSQKIASLSQKQAGLSQALAGLDPEKNSKKIQELEKQEKLTDEQIEKLERQMDRLEAEIEKSSELAELRSGPMDSLGAEMEKFEKPMEELGRKIEEHATEMYKLYPKEAIEAFEKITGERAGLNLPVPPPPPPAPAPRMGPKPPLPPRAPVAPKSMRAPKPPRAPKAPLSPIDRENPTPTPTPAQAPNPPISPK
jgi:bla regulator protein blaR1